MQEDSSFCILCRKECAEGESNLEKCHHLLPHWGRHLFVQRHTVKVTVGVVDGFPQALRQAGNL